MAEKGWELPKDMDAYMRDYNERARKANFPPERKIEVTGAQFEGSTPADSRVAIATLGQQYGTEFWMDLPNAMYLLRILSVIQKQTGAPVPTEAPSATKKP